MKKERPEPAPIKPGGQSDSCEQLTPRQRQILALLKAGKVNKEIANELGIGLGTVKQHMVALFKKLNVRNRTMAVSKEIGQQQDLQSGDGEFLVVDGLLERRPCVVLSLVLADRVPDLAWQDLQHSMTAFALGNNALLLTRKEHAVELIFGIQVCTEYDAYKAYHAAQKAALILSHYVPVEDCLRAGITAGQAIVSMQRHGGCTGEVIASMVIGRARELATEARPGILNIDRQTAALLELVMPGIAAIPKELTLTQMYEMPWRIHSDELPQLLGRDEELAALKAWLQANKQKKSALICLQGETGMGKSLLCRHLGQWYEKQDGLFHYLVCQPKSLIGNVYQYPGGKPVDFDGFVQDFFQLQATGPALLVVDDCQHLKPESIETLIQCSHLNQHKKLILAGRRFPAEVIEHAYLIKLGRLTDEFVQQIAASYLLEAEREAAVEISRRANGVPLFAQLLAKYYSRFDEQLPFILKLVIVARMDGLRLDRAVLAHIARAPGAYTIEMLAEAMRETGPSLRLAVEKSIAGGVLIENLQQQLQFTHPLLRQTVAESLVE